jgi:hypothetical protein
MKASRFPLTLYFMRADMRLARDRYNKRRDREMTQH